MRKILFVIPSLKRGGGAENVVQLVINKLSGLGYNVSTLTFYQYEDSYVVRSRVTCLNNKKPENIIHKAILAFKRAVDIKSIADKDNYDFIISFVEDANFSALIARIFFKMRGKLVISVHSSPLSRPIFYKVLIRLIYNKADYVITVSRGIAEILENKYKITKNKLRQIYNPVNFALIKKESGKTIPEKYRHFFNDGGFKFVSLGRLAKIKNYVATLKAFSLISDNFPNAKFVIIGGGSERSNIENLIFKHNLKDKVLMLGFQINPFPYLMKSDCFVFNSLSEGFGVSIVEALACSLPVISSKCKFGPEEILCTGEKTKIDEDIDKCEHGILVSVNDEKSLSKAMEIMISNAEIRTGLKKTARQRAECFNVNNIIKQWINLIENC